MPAANDAAISSSVHKAKYNHKRSRNASPRRNDSFLVGGYGVCVSVCVAGTGDDPENGSSLHAYGA